MNALKTGALALMLIITVPILLGFGMATEDVEVTRDVTTNGGNLSDAILNSESPYFMTYLGANNNSTLISETYVSGGSYESQVTTPSYSSVGSNYSSQPVYATGRSTSTPLDTPSLPLDATTTSTLAHNGSTSTVDGSSYATSVSLDDLAHGGTQMFVYGGYRNLNSDMTSGNTLVPGVINELVFSDPFTIYINGEHDAGFSFNSGTVIVYLSGAFSNYIGGSLISVVLPGSTYTSFSDIFYIEIVGSYLYPYIYTDTWHSFNSIDNYWCNYSALQNVPMMVIDGNERTYLGSVDDAHLQWFSEVGRYDYDGDSGTSTSLRFAIAHSAQFTVRNLYAYGEDNESPYDYAYIAPTQGVAYLTACTESSTYFTIFDDLSSSEGVTIIRDSEGWMVNGVLVEEYRIIPVGNDMTNVYRKCANLSPTYDGTALDVWSIDTNYSACVKLTYSVDNLQIFVAVDDLQAITYSYGLVTLRTGDSTEIYDGVSTVGIAPPAAETALDYTYHTATGSYADVTAGWTLPSNEGNVVYWYWTDGFVNDYVRMMVSIVAGESFALRADHDTNIVYVSSSSGGIVSVTIGDDTTSLGEYTSLMIELDAADDTVTVSGLTEWPPFTVSPSTMNAVTGDYDLDYFTGFYVYGISSGIDYRVDASRIQGGTYSTTYNNTLDLYRYYPTDDRQSVVIDSIGVYGDYVCIGGHRYAVTDNKITVEGTEFALLGMTIDFDHDTDNDTYTMTINDTVTTSASGGMIYFGGEWSLTLHRTVTTSETAIENQWNAGEFAFDQDDFLLAMIITTVLVFVGLGLMRGVRIGVLAVVCGAAGIIAFIIA